MNRKSANPLYTLVFLLLVALFISRPSEKKHRKAIVEHLVLRDPDHAEVHSQHVLQNLHYEDYYLISFGYLDSVKVSTGIIGRITVHTGKDQIKVLRPTRITNVK